MILGIKKPPVSYAFFDKRRKGKPSAVPLLFALTDTLIRIRMLISPLCNGSSRLFLLAKFRKSRSARSSAIHQLDVLHHPTLL